MFWKREKTVRVELENPEVRILAKQVAPLNESSNPQANPKASEITSDLVIKLIGLVTITLQGGFAVYGYSALSGHYNTFGISMSELDVSTASLLFYGYIFLFLDTFVSATKVPLVGPALPTVVLLVLAGFFVWRLKRTSSLEQKVNASLLITGALLALFFIPLCAIDSGQTLALEDIAKHGLSVPAKQLQKTHIIWTDRGKKQGILITATEKYTFLLVGTEVLKIANDGNKVMRVTQLSDKSQPATFAPSSPLSGDVIKPAAHSLPLDTIEHLPSTDQQLRF